MILASLPLFPAPPHGPTPAAAAAAPSAVDAPARPRDQYEYLRLMREHWFDELMSVESILIVLLVLGLAIAGLWLWQAWRRRHLGSAPLLSFHRIAVQAGLSLADQWVLVRIARNRRLHSPLTLMLCNSTLTDHADRYLATLTAPRRAVAARRLRRIEQQLFVPQRCQGRS